MPAGSWWVPLKQRRARLILAMLEPQAPDSLARWGLMNSVFETGFGGGGGVGEYLSEPIARRMMADNPDLRKQFEAKLAADPQFAADRTRAAAMVVPAIEVRARRFRTLPDRAGLGEELVNSSACGNLDLRSWGRVSWRQRLPTIRRSLAISPGAASDRRAAADPSRRPAAPSRPLEYYFGATGGGLWKTTDGGLTWHPVTDGQLKSSSVGAVAVVGIEPRRGLHRHGRDRTARQHHAGRRRLQIHRRRQDVEAHRARRHAGDLAHPRASRQSRRRLRLRARPPLRPERGARRLPLQGRRPDLDQRFSSATTAPAPSISASIRRIPTCSSPRSGTPIAHRGASRAADRPAASSNPPTAATTGPRSRAIPACRRASSARSAWRSRAPIAIASTPSWKTRMAACSSPTTQAPPGSCISEDRRLRQRAFYYSRIYADPKAKDTMYVLNTGFYKSTDGGKTYRTLRTPHGDNHDLWIDPTNPAAHDREQRRRRQRLGQRRRDLDRPGVSDGAALSRRHHARHSVSRLRRAAG